MHLEKVIIDHIQVDGTLTTWKISPSDESESVRIDPLTNVDPSDEDEGVVDAAGIRFYNSDSCVVEKNTTQLRSVSINNGEMSFQIEHLSIPLSKSRGIGGMYHLILPVNFRLTEFAFLDPYDSEADRIQSLRDFESENELKSLDEFKYRIYWDPSCDTQFTKMQLRSPHGSFSFFAFGKAEIYEPEIDNTKFVQASEREGSVGKILDYRMLDKGAKEKISDDMIEKINWIELKPNIFGIGININAIVKDSIDNFSNWFESQDD